MLLLLFVLSISACVTVERDGGYGVEIAGLVGKLFDEDISRQNFINEMERIKDEVPEDTFTNISIDRAYVHTRSYCEFKGLADASERYRLIEELRFIYAEGVEEVVNSFFDN